MASIKNNWRKKQQNWRNQMGNWRQIYGIWRYCHEFSCLYGGSGLLPDKIPFRAHEMRILRRSVERPLKKCIALKHNACVEENRNFFFRTTHQKRKESSFIQTIHFLS